MDSINKISFNSFNWVSNLRASSELPFNARLQISAIVLGTIFAVTDIVPSPPLSMKLVAVGSSPEYKRKVSILETLDKFSYHYT